MIAPLSFHYDFSPTTILIIALVTGVIFGFFLEKAGFGNAKKLVEQFYLTDMRMFKVLFSAIVTAMLGIFWLGYFRVIDITQIYVNATFLWPQILGGILFGVGFVMCGLCPGTACVAVSTGKLDGIAVLAGMVVGILVFGELNPVLGKLLDYSSMSDVSIYELFNVNYGFMTFLIVILALAAFWLVESVERRKA